MRLKQKNKSLYLQIYSDFFNAKASLIEIHDLREQRNGGCATDEAGWIVLMILTMVLYSSYPLY
ncbi:protein of unknown function [Chryseobacterium sp. JV274]|nr:protein of unknown function [Chryseobacterium sp. JV274]